MRKVRVDQQHVEWEVTAMMSSIMEVHQWVLHQ